MAKKGASTSINTVKNLKKLFESLTVSVPFKVGDIVVWKDGLKNKVYPRNSEPVIVIEVMDPPILSPKDDPGSVYFREPLSLVLGFIHDDGDFIFLHVDGRRFKLWEE